MTPYPNGVTPTPIHSTSGPLPITPKDFASTNHSFPNAKPTTISFPQKHVNYNPQFPSHSTLHSCVIDHLLNHNDALPSYTQTLSSYAQDLGQNRPSASKSHGFRYKSCSSVSNVTARSPQAMPRLFQFATTNSEVTSTLFHGTLEPCQVTPTDLQETVQNLPDQKLTAISSPARIDLTARLAQVTHRPLRVTPNIS